MAPDAAVKRWEPAFSDPMERKGQRRRLKESASGTHKTQGGGCGLAASESPTARLRQGLRRRGQQDYNKTPRLPQGILRAWGLGDLRGMAVRSEVRTENGQQNDVQSEDKERDTLPAQGAEERPVP